jgi:drug/metabolite transporter (DMT)-like permease
MTVPYPPTVITEPGPPAPASSPSHPSHPSAPDKRPLLFAGLGAATISTSPVFVVLSGASAVSTAFYRSAIALPVLIVLAVLEQRRHGRRPLAARLQALAAGVFLSVDLILWTHAISDVGAGVATVLGNLQVLVVVALGWLIWRERPGRAVVLALPVVIIGVVLVSGLLGQHAAAERPLAGIGYGIGMSVAYAAYLMILRRASSNTPHVAGPVADASAGTAVASLIIGLFLGGLVLHPLWPSLGWLIALALISQVAGWLLITSSLPKLPSAVGSLMLLLQPAASLALAALIIDERPTWLQIIGAALTCAGALAASLASTRSLPRPPVQAPLPIPAPTSAPTPAPTSAPAPGIEPA